MRSLLRLLHILIIAGAFSAAGGIAVAEKRVKPTARPSQPTQSEEVVIRFRTRETLDGRYHAAVEHLPSEPVCTLQRSRSVTAPRRGRVVRLRLLPPKVEGDPDTRRWCVGIYRAKVFFKQTVRCEPPVQCGDSVAKPIGSTTFTVLAEH